MASPAVLKIDIIADATKAAAAMDKTTASAQSTGSKIRAIGGAVATGFAATQVLAFGKAAIGAAQESEKASARLRSTFRGVGDETGRAAAQAEKYAGALSRKIGVDDETIMAGQAVLATFHAVSNETARTAGIFDRATAAGADLAAAGFGTIESNATQLGKALQDPTKGLTALGRAGVTFTAEQKAAIAAMQESGDLLGAQKVVLAAVEGQVKGTAAATATGADKMNVAWGETQEAIGKALLPILQKLAPILVKIAGFIEKNVSWLLPLAAALGVLAVAWQIASIAVTLFGVSMWSALWPVLLVIAAIAAIIAIGILLVRNWDTIKRWASTVWQFVLGIIRGVWDWIKKNWPLLLGILLGPIGLAVALIIRHWDTIKAGIAAVFRFIASLWPPLLDILTWPFRAAADVITGVFDNVRRAVQGVFDFVGGIVGGIVDAIKRPINVVIRAWNGLEFKLPEVKVGPVSFGGWTLGTPNIPELATGGSVLRTGLALVHRGETFSGVGGTLGGSTVINVNVTTTGLGADEPAIQRAVVDALRSYTRRNGPLPIPVRSA